MKNLQHKKFKVFFLLMLMTFFVSAQKQTKTYKESFDVNDDVLIDINTSYADVEFDTWNTNKVEIEAVIEIEGVSKEEAEKYFKDWNFKAKGNNSKVSISTSNALRSWHHGDNIMVLSTDSLDFDFDFDFDFPDSIPMPPMPPMPPMDSLMVRAPMPPMPPMPPLPFNFDSFTFDYEAYKKDGDKYMKEWKKKFNESFDEEAKANMEEWKERAEEHQAEWAERRKEMEEKFEHLRSEDGRAELRQRMQEAREAMKEAHEEIQKNRERVFIYSRSFDSNDKNLKVKKTIKIKMPKDARLKMNVRHGEVKLAENATNIHATLSYTRLLAPRVDGENSVIEASYSPVRVNDWNQGELRVNYVRDVDLKKVNSMKLISKSSNVAIQRFTGDAVINGSFGNLEIEEIADSFNTLNIILDNSEASLTLPKVGFNFFSNASNSAVTYPHQLVLDVSKKYNNEVATGYGVQKNSNKTVNLVATFSDVKLQ
ncbi:hypothetical protein OOZ15_09705 [Galbibacter sp. EGI 63066]|uniref:hypothetical protein n=1 Tax=Galbibacter sp. EGI 63066 TaxID=2993559 RepID=UPI002248D0F1|nr:hypothetical protein [Galbibacter sp. EGI 63066]MCX2680212.1 hypothetical protein [Galbibacter sp. EGI 63066]